MGAGPVSVIPKAPGIEVYAAAQQGDRLAVEEIVQFHSHLARVQRGTRIMLAGNIGVQAAVIMALGPVVHRAVLAFQLAILVLSAVVLGVLHERHTPGLHVHVTVRQEEP